MAGGDTAVRDRRGGKAAGPRFRSPRDLWLAAAAVPVALRAQRARELPLREVVRCLATRPAPSSPDALRAVAAASRAARAVRALTGGLDTCLIRSLVAGRLLAPHHEVRLVTGFRPSGAGGAAEGHAWLEVDGEPVQVAAPPDGAPFERGPSFAVGPADLEASG